MNKTPIRIIILMISALFIIISLGRSCDNDNKPIKTTTKSKKNRADSEIVAKSDDWPDSIYEIMNDTPYLSQRERGVIIEYNKCRTNPSRYAREYLTPFLNSINTDGTYKSSSGQLYTSKEGLSVIKEAIAELDTMHPLSMLRPQKYLHQAAKYHCKDTGPKGKVGHDGTDGSSPTDRGKIFNPDCIGVAESISYGFRDPQDIMIQLLVDDGVPSRGHRRGVFFKQISHIGTSIQKHKKYGYMCVVDCGY